MALLASLVAIGLLAAPAAEEPSARVALRWQAVAGAVAYEIQIAPDPSFVQPVVSERVTVNGYRWVEIPAARHYWRVRSVDRDGRTGPWSEVSTIEAALNPPEPVSPAEGTRIVWSDEPATAAFTCARSDLLRSYTIELARDPAFGVVDASQSGASPTLRLPLPGLGVFWWRARGTALTGRETGPSRARRLEVAVGAPRPLAPAPSEAVAFGPVELRWQAWTPVTRWRVSVAREGEPTWQVEVRAAAAEFVPRKTGRHRWTVAAISSDGSAGPESAPREMVVTAPPPLPAPTPLAPGPGEIVGADDLSRPARLSWEPVAGAVRYEVQAGAPGTLETAPASAATSAAISLSLPAGAIAWRARAVDVLGGPGAWSEPVRFYHGLPPSTRALVEPGAAVLVADGKDSTTLVIRLYDAEDRPVRGAPLSVTASAGRVEGLAPSGDDWTARYVAPERVPESGRSEIVVEDRGFVARASIDLRATATRWRLGLLAGWQTNLEDASAPALTLEVQWRTPWLSDRLLLAARAGTWATSATVPAQAGLPAPVEGTARVIPLSLLALYEWPVGWAALYGGAGLTVSLVDLTVGADHSLEATPGAILVAGGARALGPGEVLVEVDASFGHVDAALGQLRTGGLFLGAGYRLRP